MAFASAAVLRETAAKLEPMLAAAAEVAQTPRLPREFQAWGDRLHAEIAAYQQQITQCAVFLDQYRARA